MPRLIPDVTVLIRPKGERKFRRVELFARPQDKVEIRIDGDWHADRKQLPRASIPQIIAANIGDVGELRMSAR